MAISKRSDSSALPSPVMPVSKFRTYSSPRLRVPTVIHGPSMTKQSHKDECDINYILKRFMQTGELPDAGRIGAYGDVTGADFMEAMLLVRGAQEAFDALPSDVRERFHNSPAELLDFVDDPRNEAESLRLGLLIGKEPPKAPEAAQPLVAAPAASGKPTEGSGVVSPPGQLPT